MTGQPSVGMRRRVLLVVVLITVGIGAGALAAMRFVKSPAQVAAEAAAPIAGPVTVAVERKVMRGTVVTRGQVEAAQSVEIRATAAREGGKPLVTRLPVKVGDTVRAGQVVAEVSGRPIIVLPGEVPAYRDLRPSADGADVRQLQAALTALGHRIAGDAKGVYGASTKAAVAAAYVAAGYPAPTTGKDDAQLVLAAQRRLRDANAALNRIAQDPSVPTNAVALVDARQASADAKQDLDDLMTHTGPMVPLGEMVFVPSLPARIASIGAVVGSDAPDKLVALAVGDLVVRGGLSRVDASLIRAGQPVEIVSEIIGSTAQGIVASVGPPAAKAPTQDPGQDPGQGNAPPSAAPPEGDLELTVHGSAALDERLAGQDVRLTIEAASTEHEVLVVPLAAVSARGDGQAQVVRIDGQGREERIAVTAGVSGNGYVQVAPVAAELNPGDRVVVGT